MTGFRSILSIGGCSTNFLNKDPPKSAQRAPKTPKAPDARAPKTPKDPDTRAPKKKAHVAQTSETSKSPAAREAHLIDRAHAALRRGLLGEALLALMQHERKFSGGQLAEERDVLIIETYVTQGNTRIAKRRIQRYRKQYPKGFHRTRVNRSERKILE